MRKVIFSKRAANKMEKLLDYLEVEWSEKVKQNFIKKFDKSIGFISSFPEATEESNLKKGVHRCVVTKQTTIYYIFDETKIKVVTIFDTRMNPNKLSLNS
jgi:plasmid stabilization system protein ParE